MKRLQSDYIQKDLEKKMVLLARTRQVGKIWLAKEIGKKYNTTVYLNYDNLNDRKIMLCEEWLPDSRIPGRYGFEAVNQII
ncbi:MAG TPA: hypothetical protein VHP36_08115 [Chitinispirillaceae bacterium]|nr:hypothetical protein [Chitinispirillaceae bacterium]